MNKSISLGKFGEVGTEYSKKLGFNGRTSEEDLINIHLDSEKSSEADASDDEKDDDDVDDENKSADEEEDGEEVKVEKIFF